MVGEREREREKGVFVRERGRERERERERGVKTVGGCRTRACERRGGRRTSDS